MIRQDLVDTLTRDSASKKEVCTTQSVNNEQQVLPYHHLETNPIWLPTDETLRISQKKRRISQLFAAYQGTRTQIMLTKNI